MAELVIRRKGRKNRKHGRNKVKCAAYRSRAHRNKLTKLNRHLAVHNSDGCAARALNRAKQLV